MSDSDNESAETQLKIVIVGEPGSGKTSLASRYCHGEFSRQYYPTAGVDFFLNRTVLSGGRNVTLQIWDVGGQALVGNMLDKYVFGANIVFLVYDVTNLISFENLETWLNAVRAITASQHKKPGIILVGNKCDLEHQRAVRHDRQNKFIQENGLPFHLVSARTGENVPLCFQKTISEVLGVRLTRAEQEQQQPVMKAEIVASAAPEAPSPRPAPTVQSRSSVCSIQ
ncbi:ras-related protein Rab-28 [Anabrus simplex]|uniref:ras-related protein Rab-28 n=1 Tax=Anabrus simplex TaxID=316456 RepID=UPI0034DD4A12